MKCAICREREVYDAIDFEDGSFEIRFCKECSELVPDPIDLDSLFRVAKDTARLSKLLWEARESVAMFADIVEARAGRLDEFNRRLVAEIDAYRKERGWSPSGFGGEGTE